MRLNINLATQRYEVAQHFLQRMRALVGGLALLAILLASYILYQRAQTRDIDAKIAQARQEIDTLDNEKAQAQALLNKPANREVADDSHFLNELFARKSLSWTRVFTEMERLMPPNIHVVSMKPDYTKDNQLMLHMVVATDDRSRAVELVRLMEKSNHFGSPQVVAENVTTNSSDQGAGPGNIQFDIAALYLPYAQDLPEKQNGAQPQKPGASAEKTEATAAKPVEATTAQSGGGKR